MYNSHDDDSEDLSDTTLHANLFDLKDLFEQINRSDIFCENVLEHEDSIEGHHEVLSSEKKNQTRIRILGDNTQ